MSLKYTGIITKIMAEHQVNDKFKKREFVLSDNSPSYPQTIIFQMTQDRCSLLDKFKEGQEVEVDFSLKGREWKNPQGEVKYFNTLDAFRIFATNASNASHPPATRQNPNNKTQQESVLVPTPDDDLPF